MEKRQARQDGAPYSSMCLHRPTITRAATTPSAPQILRDLELKGFGARCQHVSLPMIGKLLGHANTQTTARYAHLADNPSQQLNDSVGGYPRGRIR